MIRELRRLLFTSSVDVFPFLAASALPTWQNWIRVRHALKFTLRRKPIIPPSPPLSHPDRQIPTISVSLESDDEQLGESKRARKSKKNSSNQDNGAVGMADETDVDDESMQFVRTYHRRRRLGENETTQSSTLERHDTSATQSRLTSSPIDDEPLLTRKQSKIGKSSSALPKRQVRSRSINRQQQC